MRSLELQSADRSFPRGRTIFLNRLNPYLCDGVSRSSLELLQLLQRCGIEVGIVQTIVDEYSYRRQMFDHFGRSCLTRNAVYSGSQCEVDFGGITTLVRLLPQSTPAATVVRVLAEMLGHLGASVAVTAEDDILGLAAVAMVGLRGLHLFHSLSCVQQYARNELALRLLSGRPIVCCSRFLRGKTRALLGCEASVLHPVSRLAASTVTGRPLRGTNCVGFYSGGRHKGDEILVHVARSLPEVRFLVIGRCFSASGYAPANVAALGDIEDTSGFYSRIDVLLVPSLCEEAFSRMAVEACANGIPVVANKVGGIPEALGRAGILVDLDVEGSDTGRLASIYAQTVDSLLSVPQTWQEQSRKSTARWGSYCRRHREQSQTLLRVLFATGQ